MFLFIVNETTINQKNRNIENIEHPSLQKYESVFTKYLEK